jgi:uncharacterized heparinase superfamily protein
MQSPSWYLHRLRSMTQAEILWRLKSQLSAQLDLVRIPLGMYPKLDPAAAAAATERRGFRCCQLADDAAPWPDAEPYRRWRARLVAQADPILENRLSYFDLVDRFHGDPVDWHRDFAAGRSAPRKLSGLIDYRDFTTVGDCKLVWEPNRHHQLVVLARAWRVTGDRRYARKVSGLLAEWLESNPFGYGMNWRSPLEVAVRLINWIYAVDLVREAAIFSDAQWQRIANAVYVSVWDTQRKFSKGSSANNHLVGEAAGVFIVATYFPDLPGAAECRARSRRILEREIVAQTYADGCTREHAFGYQFFVIQFYTLCLLAGERSGAPFSAEYREHLHRMYAFLADLSAETGRPPNMGDADDGYVLDLGEKPPDAKPLLAVGARLFGDSSLAQSGESETAFWLLGAGSTDDLRPPVERSSRACRESGYFLLRTESGKASGGPRVRILFDCAALGYGPIAAHGHADCLSFTLALDGQEVFVDPGTYDYFSYPEWREYFRSTAAHNTAEVDGASQSEPLGPFLWGKRAEAGLVEWQDDPERVHVCGQHDGYTRLAVPVIHRRAITLDKASGAVEIVDRFRSSAAHAVSVYFHLAAGITADSESDRSVRIRAPARVLGLRADQGVFRVLRADASGPAGWVSDGYHRRQPASVIVLDCRVEGDGEIRFRLDVCATGGKRSNVM